MAIKRGVSFYSYQQAQFFGQMTTLDMLRELHDNLRCDGVQIINEATVPRYPFPTREFLAQWHNDIARYDMFPVCLNSFLDTLRFRDHVMTKGEAAELVKLDLQLASDMGFKHFRTMTALPTDVIARALPTAEKLNVKIAWEIHAPIPIKPNPSIKGIFCDNPGTAVADTVEFIEKTGTKHVGFVPDMGVFTRGPFLDSVEAAIRHILDRQLAKGITKIKESVPLAQLGREVEKAFPGKLDPGTMRAFAWRGSTAEPEDLELILPYICSFHGKAQDRFIGNGMGPIRFTHDPACLWAGRLKLGRRAHARGEAAHPTNDRSKPAGVCLARL